MGCLLIIKYGHEYYRYYFWLRLLPRRQKKINFVFLHTVRLLKLSWYHVLVGVQV